MVHQISWQIDRALNKNGHVWKYMALTVLTISKSYKISHLRRSIFDPGMFK